MERDPRNVVLDIIDGANWLAKQLLAERNAHAATKKQLEELSNINSETKNGSPQV